MPKAAGECSSPSVLSGTQDVHTIYVQPEVGKVHDRMNHIVMRRGRCTKYDYLHPHILRARGHKR